MDMFAERRGKSLIGNYLQIGECFARTYFAD